LLPSFFLHNLAARKCLLKVIHLFNQAPRPPISLHR
jgi:hypothetical protein